MDRLHLFTHTLFLKYLCAFPSIVKKSESPPFYWWWWEQGPWLVWHMAVFQWRPCCHKFLLCLRAALPDSSFSLFLFVLNSFQSLLWFMWHLFVSASLGSFWNSPFLSVCQSSCLWSKVSEFTREFNDGVRGDTPHIPDEHGCVCEYSVNENWVVTFWCMLFELSFSNEE
jgi:hypothetical protein